MFWLHRLLPATDRLKGYEYTAPAARMEKRKKLFFAPADSVCIADARSRKKEGHEIKLSLG